MSDRYQDLVHTPVGKFLVKNLGLPDPPRLERYRAGDPLVSGTVLVGSAPGSTLGTALDDALGTLAVTVTRSVADGERLKGIVFDATGLESAADLDLLQEFLTPVLRNLGASGRVVLIGTPPEHADSAGRAIAQRALEGVSRSLGKELGKGSTAQTVYVARGAEGAIASTLGFLLSPKSAYVSGQVVRIGTAGVTDAPSFDPLAPLTGKVALVTGASRGLGLAMAQTLHRDGATVIGLDVAPLADDLQREMAALGGESIVLDITAPDAPQRIAAYVMQHHGGVDVVVHNAGITRDKRLRNMKTENWHKVVEINVDAPQRITAELLDQKLIRSGGTVLGVSSIAGIAGNNGQTNYAASKAGVIGWVNELAPRVAEDGISVNAVAPGFIETDMVKTIPLTIREAGRRMNSMSQGGQPVDVAETIAWFANPGSAAVSGNVVRVCGQSLLGA
ncbi:3-oxoacyl-ACP reductase [Mumia sp. zg.B53]|uniref:3-oxoacyl-ACP reductase n=1 Tax=unclassified Mumia TaxID=2621872 RepID=UPI001C6E0D20|nr:MULTISPECIES: 3-oxoacyl-ACP reductase [unclassified Mumia]MBW9208744.1 3-oxoacyl-ACP reductase [Mumia sp. zg.B21]MBW9213355.1 3-oxoacyl-ACP reductase [Mumia sp. zg.B53]